MDRLTDRPNMTSAVYRGRKTTKDNQTIERMDGWMDGRTDGWMDRLKEDGHTHTEGQSTE